MDAHAFPFFYLRVLSILLVPDDCYRSISFTKDDTNRKLNLTVKIIAPLLHFRQSNLRLIAKRLSARLLILQYSLATCCMYVSHTLECNYNREDFCYIIDTAIASALCMYYTPYMYMHVLLRWNVERSWPGFENEGIEREMAEKHAMTRPGSISKHQELVRQVSKGQSTMINTLHKALSSSILSSHHLQVC